MSNQPTLNIDPGALRGIGSLNFFVGPALKKFTRAVLAQKTPDVSWDLSGLSAQGTNLAALTALLAISHRLRLFSSKPQHLIFQWKPALFTFLDDIGFFKIGREANLFTYDIHVVGGYSRRLTNPNTKLHFFQIEPCPGYEPDNELRAWKAIKRYEYKIRLETAAAGLFRERHGQYPFTRQLRETVFVTTAELIVNSLLHGSSPAFVGMQRSTIGISVSVCDAGHGLLNSLKAQHLDKMIDVPNRNAINSILLASTVNLKEHGLKMAIDEIIRNGGWVRVATDNAEIRWAAPNWLPIRREFEQSHWIQTAQTTFDLDSLGPSNSKSWTTETKKFGWRIYSSPIRGTRIAFEIPITVNDGTRIFPHERF
jgi:hypothetical protein